MRSLSTDGVVIDSIADPELDRPTLIEGLPGVGHVGKLAVEHLLQEGDPQLVRELYSEHFPPQVSVDSDGIASLPSMSLHHVTIESSGDLLLLSGNHQAASGIGHYRLSNAILDAAESFGVEQIFTIGGVPTGELTENPAVVGAVTDPELRDELEPCGIEFRESEPSGGVVGASGLLVGLGDKRGLDAACLMGETSGYLVDPKSAQAVLETLEAAIDFSIDYERLEARAREMEEVVRKLQEMHDQQVEVPSDDDLRYID